MLSDLQRRIAKVVLEHTPDPDLALAGGAALISRELVDRTTTDLDFFTTGARIPGIVESIEPALRATGLEVQRLHVTPTFARLLVSGPDDRCQIDFAQDARIMGTEQGSLGPTIRAEELAADKVLALFSRAIGRDFVDVYFLARRFGKQRSLELAQEKDLGFDERVFADMLGAIGRLDRQEFEVDDAVLDDLQAFFASWREELVAR